MHGQFGEDGYIQTILETTKIPYTHSGVLASAIAMDKELSKKIFKKNNILTPKYILYSFDKPKLNLLSEIKKKLKFPVVIKPINEGSSVNVFICNKLNISVYDVLDASSTKWNFLKFSPGLVGGHCIGVDPYYLSYKSMKLKIDWNS